MYIYCIVIGEWISLATHHRLWTTGCTVMTGNYGHGSRTSPLFTRFYRSDLRILVLAKYGNTQWEYCSVSTLKVRAKHRAIFIVVMKE